MIIYILLYGGHLSRDCGQFLNLNVSDPTLKGQFQGLWAIYSCAHVFEGTSYTNELVCYRTVRQDVPNLVEKK